MFRQQLLGVVVVLVLNDAFAFAQQLQPSSNPIYKLPITQDIILMTNGTPGIGSVARQSLLGHLGIRQTDTCPTGTIAVCTNSTFPCCDVRYPVCCPSSSICCSSTTRCVQTTTGVTACCQANDLVCPGGCCPANTTCCNQYCCTSDYDCKPDSAGALSCVFRFIPTTSSDSTWQHRSAAGSQTEIDPIASAIAEQESQDAARRKYQITVGVAAGVSVGTIVLVMCLALWFYLRRRRSKLIAKLAAKEAQQPEQDPTATDSQPRHSPAIAMNDLGSSQTGNQVASGRSSSHSLDIVPPWLTGYLAAHLAAPYHHSPVQSSQPPPYIEDTGTNALLLHPNPEPSTYRVEKEI